MDLNSFLHPALSYYAYFQITFGIALILLKESGLLSWYSDYVMGWMGVELGFDSWWRQEIFVSSKAFRLAVVATQAPVRWVPGAFFTGVKWSSAFS